jgi:hypothetical protein
MLLHVGQHSVEGGQICFIRGDADFAKKQTISVRFRPLRDCGQSLYADGCGDGARVAAAIPVEILMDLERKIMRGVLNSAADDCGIVRV